MALPLEGRWPAVKTPVQQSYIEHAEDEHQQNAEIPENKLYVSQTNSEFAVFPGSTAYAEVYQRNDYNVIFTFEVGGNKLVICGTVLLSLLFCFA